MTDRQLKNQLVKGLAAFDDVIKEREQFAEEVLKFTRELIKWNKTYNLTAVKDPGQIITLHMLDSLAVLPFLPIHSQGIIDVGSGGGFPGIPLAMAMPDQQFLLLDSNGKKSRFLNHVKITLNLHNVEVVHSRVRDFAGKFELVLCRAFASLEEIVDHTAHLMNDQGRIFAMKGKIETLSERNAIAFKETWHKLEVPGLDAERHLAVLERRDGRAVSVKK